MNRLLAAAALSIAMITTAPTSAAVVTTYVGADLTSSPYTINLGSGSLTFSTVDSSFFALNPTGVQTSGSAQVFSLGFPFYAAPTPTSYFTDRGGEFGPGGLGFFASYGSPAAIPYSIAEGLVGFGFTLADGLHYGYADIGGSTLFGYRYETTADTGIPLGAVTGISAVPEPGAWLLMIAGFGMTGFAIRRGRRFNLRVAGT